MGYMCKYCPADTTFGIAYNSENEPQIINTYFTAYHKKQTYFIKLNHLDHSTVILKKHHPGPTKITQLPLLSISPSSAASTLHRILKNKAFL